jgi:uncharacterized protein YpmS
MNLYIVLLPLLSLLFFATIAVILIFQKSKYRDRVEDDSSTDSGTLQRQISSRRLELETYVAGEMELQISTRRRLELETYGRDTTPIGS